VVSARSRRDAKEDENAQKSGTSSALSKLLPNMAKTTRRENIYTIPNLLTASRLVAAPFIGYCILHDYHAWTLGLFAYAGITDALDGWIARRWNLGTVVGTIIDPMADKTLMTVLTVGLAMKGALPVWLAVIILGRDVALAISAIYYRWISLPPPKTFARYWDFSLPSAEVRPTLISKVNTALQLGLMGMTVLAPVIPAVEMSTALGVMQYVVDDDCLERGELRLQQGRRQDLDAPGGREESRGEEGRGHEDRFQVKRLDHWWPNPRQLPDISRHLRHLSAYAGNHSDTQVSRRPHSNLYTSIVLVHVHNQRHGADSRRFDNFLIP